MQSCMQLCSIRPFQPELVVAYHATLSRGRQVGDMNGRKANPEVILMQKSAVAAVTGKAGDSVALCGRDGSFPDGV